MGKETKYPDYSFKKDNVFESDQIELFAAVERNTGVFLSIGCDGGTAVFKNRHQANETARWHAFHYSRNTTTIKFTVPRVLVKQLGLGVVPTKADIKEHNRRRLKFDRFFNSALRKFNRKEKYFNKRQLEDFIDNEIEYARQRCYKTFSKNLKIPEKFWRDLLNAGPGWRRSKKYVGYKYLSWQDLDNPKCPDLIKHFARISHSELPYAVLNRHYQDYLEKCEEQKEDLIRTLQNEDKK